MSLRNLLGALATAALVCLTPTAHAQDEEPVPPSASQAEGWAVATFEELGFDEATRRYNTAPTMTFWFTTRGDEVLTNARVTLEVEGPAGGWDGITGMDISVNDEPVTTLTTSQLTGQPRHVINVDSRLLTETNSLTLRLTQGGATPCDEVVKAGKWALVKNGTLETRGSALPLQDDLGILPLPFYDPGYDRQAEIPVAFLVPPDQDTLYAAGLVANYFGLLTGSKARFPVTVNELPEGSAVVLAVGNGLEGVLSLPPVDGPTLRLIDHPDHPGANKKLLVFQGATLADLATAAKGLLLSDERPFGPSWPVGWHADPPARVPYDAPRWLPPVEAVHFEDIQGGKELTHVGQTGGTMEVSFRVAPDLFTWPRDLLRLEVDYEQVAPRQDLVPTIIVELNGRYVTTLPRARADAADPFHTATVELHRTQIRGFNRLQFHVSWKGAEPACDALIAEDVSSTILPTSRIVFRETPHFAQLPNIESFVEDGYPFTRMADLSDTVVVVPDDVQPPEIASFLSVMAHFAAVTGWPSYRVTVLDATAAAGQLPWEQDLLVIGSIEHLPLWGKLTAHLPIDARAGRLSVRQPTWTQKALDLLGGHLTGRQADELGTRLLSRRAHGLVVGAPVPTGNGRSAVLVTANEAAAIPAMPDMVGFAEASQPGGDVLLVSGEERFRYRVGGVYHVGQVDEFTRLRWVVSNHWLVLLPAVLLAALLLSRTWFSSLSAQERKRLELAGDRG